MQKTLLRSTRIISGAIAGGIMGYILGLMILSIPAIRQLMAAVPFPMPVTLTVAGIVFGGVISVLTAQKAPLVSRGKQMEKAKMTLREEQLDIGKEKVRTGDVDIHKEVVTDNKTVTVPVSREELVAEHKTDRGKETVRIPLSEEHIDGGKWGRFLLAPNDTQRREYCYTFTRIRKLFTRGDKLSSNKKHPHIERPLAEQLSSVLGGKTPIMRQLYLDMHLLVLETLPLVVYLIDCKDGQIGYGARQYGYNGWGMAARSAHKTWASLMLMRGPTLKIAIDCSKVPAKRCGMLS